MSRTYLSLVSALLLASAVQADDPLSPKQRFTEVIFSADGKSLFAGREDGTVHHLDAASGRKMRVFDGQQGCVLALALARGGRLLVSAGEDKSVIFWDITTGKRAL